MARMPLPTAPIPVRQLPSNLTGRDFIVADLHGQREALLRLLRHVQFRPTQDRLFSVGNLVDRGPESFECLQLLTKPWFYGCLGDREARLLAWLRDASFPLTPAQAWLTEQAPTPEAHAALGRAWKPLLEVLPAVWVVGGDTPKRFQVVHGELFKTGAPLTHAAIDGWQFADPDQVLVQAREGRSLVAAWRAQTPIRRYFAPRLSPIYCGHTVVPRACWLGPHLLLNMGAGMVEGVTPEAGELIAKQPPIQPGLALLEAGGRSVWWTSVLTPESDVSTLSLAELDAF